MDSMVGVNRLLQSTVTPVRILVKRGKGRVSELLTLHQGQVNLNQGVIGILDEGHWR